MNKFKQEIKKLIISFLCVLFCIFLAFVGVNYYLEYQAPSKINKMIEKLQIEEKGSDLTFIQDSDNNDFENRKIASEFGCKPNRACEYCNGFDVKEGKRYPAAVQKR